jgi:hypothetical protein
VSSRLKPCDFNAPNSVSIPQRYFLLLVRLFAEFGRDQNKVAKICVPNRGEEESRNQSTIYDRYDIDMIRHKNAFPRLVYYFGNLHIWLVITRRFTATTEGSQYNTETTCRPILYDHNVMKSATNERNDYRVKNCTRWSSGGRRPWRILKPKSPPSNLNAFRRFTVRRALEFRYGGV